MQAVVSICKLVQQLIVSYEIIRQKLVPESELMGGWYKTALLRGIVLLLATQVEYIYNKVLRCIIVLSVITQVGKIQAEYV